MPVPGDPPWLVDALEKIHPWIEHDVDKDAIRAVLWALPRAFPDTELPDLLFNVIAQYRTEEPRD